MKKLTLSSLFVACTCFSLASCGESEPFEEVVAASGGRIEIYFEYHDDPSKLVNARVRTKDRTVIADKVRLGATKRLYGLGTNRFGLYETADGRAGLYRESNPDILLFAVDFETEEVFSKIGSRWGSSEEKREGILADLSEVAGRPVEFATYPEPF